MRQTRSVWREAFDDLAGPVYGLVVASMLVLTGLGFGCLFYWVLP